MESFTASIKLYNSHTVIMYYTEVHFTVELHNFTTLCGALLFEILKRTLYCTPGCCIIADFK